MLVLVLFVSVVFFKNLGERNFFSFLIDDKKMGVVIWFKWFVDCIKKYIWYEYICVIIVELVSVEFY